MSVISYAVQSRQKNIRLRSTSGGTFSEIARSFIRTGGCVCAAGYDEQGKVVHKLINTISEIDELCESKYVQSDLNNCFADVESCLSSSRKVLFVGTPCQVAGVKAYLRNKDEKLYTIDLVCYGVPSPMIYTLYNKDFTVMDGGIIGVDGYRPVQEVMEEVLAEHGHSVSECGVISAEYLQEQSYRAETQRAEAMKEKLAAEKPAPEATISFYVAECAEFPVMGEFHDNLTLEQALEVYDKIPSERMNGIKSIGFSLEDGSIYSGMFDLMVGGEVQAEVVNHIQHYRESPLVQKAILDMKTLLEKRQASKELEERPSTRQSVREALKNRKKAQEQQSNQEQEKPKKAKKKGEMEL